MQLILFTAIKKKKILALTDDWHTHLISLKGHNLPDESHITGFPTLISCLYKALKPKTLDRGGSAQMSKGS